MPLTPNNLNLKTNYYARSLKEANLENARKICSAAASSQRTSGSFELLEADLAEPETYQKLKFLAGSLPAASNGQSSIIDHQSLNGTFAAIIHELPQR